MSTLYRLKAYFGMVPAEDMDAYLDYDDDDHTDHRDDHRGHDYYEDDGRRHRGYQDSYQHADEGRSGYAGERHSSDYRYADRQHGDRRYADDEPRRSLSEPGRAGLGSSSASASRSSLVRGSLAVEPNSVVEPRRPVTLTASEQPADATSSSLSTSVPLSRITTVHPRSYEEARTIGERYRDGIPVIMNLTELDDAPAKRIVDFAAGLVFALRGSFDKITNRVFLLSPPGVEVSADDRRKLAERGFFSQD